MLFSLTEPDHAADAPEVETVLPPADVKAAGKRRGRLIDAAVAAIYLLGGYLVTSQMWKSPTSLTSSQNDNDQAFFEWMLQHAVRVFTHGDNPLFTTQLNAPLGVNLMSNTNILGLAIPFAPLTAWLGPAPVFVLLIMLGLAGTAYAWYYVLSRHFVHHRLGAFVGAAFCGFGPGIITHANGHPNLTAQFVIPFILWRALALRTSRRPVRDGLVLGLLVTYQAFLNEELLFLAALGGAVFAVVYAAFRRSIIQPAIKGMLIGLGTAGLLSLALLAYPLWYQFRGPQHFSGLPAFLTTYPYELSLSSFKTLPTLSLWGSADAYQLGAEQNSFLGWAILVVTVGIIVLLWRRRPAVRALAVVGILAAWASLGNRIVVGNPVHTYPNYKSYPYSLWRHLSDKPLFDSVLAGRLALILLPVVGLLLAFAVTDAVSALGRARIAKQSARMIALACALAAIVAALVTIIPTPVTTQPRAAVPTFFTSGQWRSYVPPGDTVLSATPYDWTPEMQWAIAANLSFGIPGGYFLGPAPLAPGQTTPVGQFGPQWRMTQRILGEAGIDSPMLPFDIPSFYPTAIADLTFWHTAIIVLTADQPNYAKVKDTVTKLLGQPGHQVGDVWLWDVRSITS
jgi:hypothetical protein